MTAIDLEQPIVRAGVLPVVANANGIREYMVLEFCDDPGHDLMICKGKRLIRDVLGNEMYREICQTDFPLNEQLLEPPEQAARREAQEELGLIIPHTSILEEIGVAYYMVYDRTASAFVPLPFILYIVNFTADNKIALSSLRGSVSGQETCARWVTLNEFLELGRSDHVTILQKVEDLLNEL
jgi:ADP-ribose pyrophosphatase YjhB (NUDIX family)